MTQLNKKYLVVGDLVYIQDISFNILNIVHCLFIT